MNKFLFWWIFGWVAVGVFMVAVLWQPQKLKAIPVSTGPSASVSHDLSRLAANQEDPTTTTTSTTLPVRPTPKPIRREVARSAPMPVGGDFAACVRGVESTNRYGYNDGTYHGAYNMTLSHWDHYQGYPTPESAPPSVQDAKFQSDAAQGSSYMHQQYPVSSRRCGM